MADADQDDPAGDANSASTPGGPTLSVVAPAHNEAENIAQLVEQTGRALSVAGVSFELIIVDDGSTDATRTRIAEHMPTRPWLRGLSMRQTPPGKGNGQSAAFHAGIRAARGVFIATIDADLQNDPADLPAMLELSRERNADFVQGDRSHARRDNFIRRASSRVGRFFRRLILRDVVRDTGGSLAVAYGHLDDDIAHGVGEKGHEAVHAAELQRKAQRDLSAHDAERAAGIADDIAQDQPAEEPP
ncbi:MAG: glycosyltransferase family 2 protein, partial [Planctomyces sp.]